MTNGEKLKEIFPNLEYEILSCTVLTNIDNNTWFSLEWWNAEYKESTTKNCESCRYYGLYREVCNYCYKCSFWAEKESTTKNDLDFKLKDYVSREAVRRIIKSPRTQEQMLNALNSLRNVTECNVEDCINRDYTAKYVEEFANNEYVSQDEAETIYLIADGIRHIPSVLPDAAVQRWLSHRKVRNKEQKYGKA